MNCPHCGAQGVDFLRHVGAADQQCKNCTQVQAVIEEALGAEGFFATVTHFERVGRDAYEILFDFVALGDKQLNDNEIAKELCHALRIVTEALCETNNELGEDWIPEVPFLELSEMWEKRDERLKLIAEKLDEDFSDSYRTAVYSHRRDLRAAWKNNNQAVRAKMIEAADAKLNCRVTAAEAAFAAGQALLDRQHDAEVIPHARNYSRG